MRRRRAIIPGMCLHLRETARFCVAALLAVATSAAFARALPAEVAAALERAKLPRDAIAVVVQEVGSERNRLAWQADRPVNPASLMKLVTTGAALDLLGPAWTWSTPVWLDGSVDPVQGVLHGNLVIQGSGDPKLVLERVWMMLRRVQQMGVREIRGDIVLDRSAFPIAERHPGDFDGEPLRPQNVQPDALLLNQRSVILSFTPDTQRGVAVVSADAPLAGVQLDATVPLATGNCDDWRAALKAELADPARMRFGGAFPGTCGERQWPLAYAEPRRYNERLLLGLWREMGGSLGGVVRDGRAPPGPPSFTLTSPPLAEVARDINKFSNNVMAQQLFLTLGHVQRGSGTPELAREVVAQWAAGRFGEAATRSLAIDNGSGLSREGRLSAQLLARVLQAAWASPVMPELISSLPVIGIDGTMRRSRTALGRAHLKSGSLRDVAAVAGFVLSERGRRYVVVAIVNHPNAVAARPAIEALVQWAASDGRSDRAPPD